MEWFRSLEDNSLLKVESAFNKMSLHVWGWLKSAETKSFYKGDNCIIDNLISILTKLVTGYLPFYVISDRKECINR